MSPEQRFLSHISDKHGTMYFPIHKYGVENFKIDSIDHAESKEEANIKEKFWTLYYNSASEEFGYNLAVVHSLYGERNHRYARPMSHETKGKISESLKGRYCGEKNPFYGKKHSESTLEKVRGCNHWTARKSFSEESRAKMSAAQYGSKSNNHRACKCIETGETFPYVKAVTRKYGYSESHIHSVCKGRRNRCGGYHWEYISDAEVIHNLE